MKKTAFLTILLAALATASMASIVRSGKVIRDRNAAIQKLTIVQTMNSTGVGDINSSDTMTDTIWGTLHRIVINSDGTDTAWTVTIYDENLATVFSKTDVSTASNPVGVAIHNDDTNADPHGGVAVGGSLKFTSSALAYTPEVQTINTTDGNDPNGGTFILYFEDVNTDAIAYDANYLEIVTALEAISTLNDLTSTPLDYNDTLQDADLVITFAGLEIYENVALIQIDVNGTTVTTSDPNNLVGTVTETTQGHPDINEITLTVYFTEDLQ